MFRVGARDLTSVVDDHSEFTNFIPSGHKGLECTVSSPHKTTNVLLASVIFCDRAPVVNAPGLRPARPRRVERRNCAISNTHEAVLYTAVVHVRPGDHANIVDTLGRGPDRTLWIERCNCATGSPQEAVVDLIGIFPISFNLASAATLKALEADPTMRTFLPSDIARLCLARALHQRGFFCFAR
jgi:hypothetical protein